MTREQMQALDPTVRVLRVTLFLETMAGPLARPRFDALLSDLFGLVAAVLAGVGLSAVMGYKTITPTVAQRP